MLQNGPQNWPKNPSSFSIQLTSIGSSITSLSKNHFISLSSSWNTFSTLFCRGNNKLYILMWPCVLSLFFHHIITNLTWYCDKTCPSCKVLVPCHFFFFKTFINYLKVPPNVGVQYSTVGSWVIGNVLETGTKHSPLLLRSCFGPSASLDLPELYKNNKN